MTPLSSQESRDCFLNAYRDRYLKGSPTLENIVSSLAGVMTKLGDHKRCVPLDCVDRSDGVWGLWRGTSEGDRELASKWQRWHSAEPSGQA